MISLVPIVLLFSSLISAIFFFIPYRKEKQKRLKIQETLNTLQTSFLANRRITYELAVLKETIQNFSLHQELDPLINNLLKSLSNILPVPATSFLSLTDLEGEVRVYSSLSLTEEQKSLFGADQLDSSQEIIFYNGNKNFPKLLECLNFSRGIAIPLKRQERIMGEFILAVSQSYDFSKEDTRLLATISNQAALAIENLLLYEQQLTQSKQLASLGEVTAGIAHEVKNPLAIIRGFAECLPLDLDSPEEIIHTSQLILKEVDRLNKIISEVLHFARPPQPDFVPSDINKVILQTLELVKGELAKSQVILETSLGANLPKILLDIEQMRQVFLNLILNALEAMPEGGKLRIETYSSEPNKVVAIFQDNGCGIPEENLSHIFRPFFSSKRKGTGLGLAITARIVENHKGKIQVESLFKQGTTFSLHFPGFKV